MNALTAKIESLSAQALRALAMAAAAADTEENNMVLDAILMQLEQIMPTAEFVDFCTQIEP